jgi:hypothetical protein
LPGGVAVAVDVGVSVGVAVDVAVLDGVAVLVGLPFPPPLFPSPFPPPGDVVVAVADGPAVTVCVTGAPPTPVRVGVDVAVGVGEAVRFAVVAEVAEGRAVGVGVALAGKVTPPMVTVAVAGCPVVVLRAAVGAVPELPAGVESSVPFASSTAAATIRTEIGLRACGATSWL